jgi:hypothetical protein
VAADLNDDGVVDLFIVNGRNEYLGPNRQPPRADASKDISKEGQNSQPQPGDSYKHSGKQGPKSSPQEGRPKTDSGQQARKPQSP